MVKANHALATQRWMQRIRVRGLRAGLVIAGGRFSLNSDHVLASSWRCFTEGLISA